MDYQPLLRIETREGRTWLMDGEQTVLCKFNPELVCIGCGRLAPGGYEMFPRPGMRSGPYGWLYPSPQWGR